jgi:nitroreductase
MELMEAIRTRRSVRSYEAKPVEKATLERLLEAAVQAPSASNTQPWAFGVIQGAERLKTLSDRAKALLLEQTKGNESAASLRARLSDPSFSIYYGAPALVCIYTKSTGGHAKTDCAMAAQNLMLAAHAHGLGTCWIGLGQLLFESAEMKKELGVPAEYVPVGQLIVGHPEGSLPAPTDRKTPEVIFWE